MKCVKCAKCAKCVKCVKCMYRTRFTEAQSVKFHTLGECKCEMYTRKICGYGGGNRIFWIKWAIFHTFHAFHALCIQVKKTEVYTGFTDSRSVNLYANFTLQCVKKSRGSVKFARQCVNFALVFTHGKEKEGAKATPSFLF